MSDKKKDSEVTIVDESMSDNTLKERGQVPPPYHSELLSVDDYSVVCISGPHKGLKVRLDTPLLHLGRADWCEIAIPLDRRVSRHHCEIQLSDEGIRVRDLGSSNGCYMGEVRIFEAPFTHEHALKVGDSEFVLSTEQNQRKIKVNYHDDTCKLVGKSNQMRKIFTFLSRLGPWDAPVLLYGETGTGKTSVAQALHEQSDRGKKNMPFVQVNCGALSANLIESSLFGYEKGAFTDAKQRHRGYFEQANGGTLFLDEIGELPLELQPKLLDVLERKRIRRLGGEREIEVDFRLVAATHRNIEQAIAQKQFREDLYFRIAVVELDIPPLRDRLEDIPFLTEHILVSLRKNERIQITPEAMTKLQSHLWPGNVRELRNTLERSLLFAKGSTLDEDDLSISTRRHRTEEYTQPQFAPAPVNLSSTPATPQPPTRPTIPTLSDDSSLQERLDREEGRILKEALERYNWDLKEVGRMLGISRSSLYNRLNKHKLTREE